MNGVAYWLLSLDFHREQLLGHPGFLEGSWLEQETMCIPLLGIMLEGEYLQKAFWFRFQYKHSAGSPQPVVPCNPRASPVQPAGPCFLHPGFVDECAAQGGMGSTSAITAFSKLAEITRVFCSKKSTSTPVQMRNQASTYWKIAVAIAAAFFTP